MIRRICIVLAVLSAGPADALSLPMPPAATMVAEDTAALDSLSLPVGPWSDGQIEVFAEEGRVTRQAWMVPGSTLTSLQIIAPIRAALEEAGFEVLYECKDVDCGGFDFRYQLALLPEPEMHVDLGDYRYLAAEPGSGAETRFVSVVVSRSADAGFVHVTLVGEAAPPADTVDPAGEAPTSAPPAAIPAPAAPASNNADPPLGQRLETDGYAVLDGLRFATGSAALENQLFPSLVALAEWLNTRADVRIILVGHSDDVGELVSNVALSKARAQSVVDRLVSAHGVAPGQLSAEGVGYLAPRASNATEQGRARNRRVEALLAPAR